MNIGSTGKFNISDISELGPANGLVGWWPFNEDASDFGTGRNNGTINGATITSGLNGQAYLFDGVDDYINCGTPVLGLDGTFTVSAWIYPTAATQSGNGIIAKSSSNKREFFFRLNPDNNLYIWTSTDGGGADQAFDSGVSVTLNQWSHVLVTLSSSSVIFYINGVPVSTQNGSYTYFNSDGLLRIGNWAENTTWTFAGKIDDPRIYNRVLTSEDVNILYRITEPNGSKMIQTKDTLYVKGQFLEI